MSYVPELLVYYGVIPVFIYLSLKLYMISKKNYQNKITYEPEFVPELVVHDEIIPFIEYMALDNETIRYSIYHYFDEAEETDIIIKKYGRIEDWNTSEVTDMSGLFQDIIYTDINIYISKWDVSKVTDMSFMFYDVKGFISDIGEWDTSNVTTMKCMFSNAKSFNQDISGWDTSNVTTMKGMFSNAKSFNQDISGWDVSKVTDMSFMFYKTFEFNQYSIFKCWDISNVDHMNGMFDNAKGYSYSDLSRLSCYVVSKNKSEAEICSNEELWAKYIINEDFGYKERDFYDFLSYKSRKELEKIMQLTGFDI